jgi:uncharacterized protein (TIGR03437 family)
MHYRTLQMSALAVFGLACLVRADVSSINTLPPSTVLDLDTGVSSSLPGGGTGDIVWTGTALMPAPGVTNVSLLIYPGGSGFATFQQLAQSDLASLSFPTGASSISVSQLSLNVILAAKTKSGNYSKLLVSSFASGGSLALRLTTFTPTPQAPPTITAVENNYSQIPQGLPNYGIAPSSLFFIKGTGLASVNDLGSLRSSAAPGLQTTADGVTVSVTIGSTTVNCPIYYLSPGQIDAVLPGTTPIGQGFLTVTNNGVKSFNSSITVTPSGFGIISYNASLAATYDASNQIITALNAANPRQTIVIYGTGVGPDPDNDDRLYPQKLNNLTNIPMQVLVGNQPATILYRGRSPFPGVDQINITLPPNVSTGCYVSLIVVAGGVVSNSTTIPVAAGGSVCSDPSQPITPTQMRTFAAKPTVQAGTLTLSQATFIAAGSNRLTNTVTGVFQVVKGYFSGAGNGQASNGNCVVTNTLQQAQSTGQPVATLSAGTGILVSGPQGSLTLMQNTPDQPSNVYTVSNVPNGFLAPSGGTYTLDNGAGGKDVGHFNSSLGFPANFAWTNPGLVTAIDRTQDLTITWSGGAPGLYVTITGGSTTMIQDQPVTVTFACQADLSLGRFTVPAPILSEIPVGQGTLGLTDYSATQLITPQGIDFGLLTASVGFSEIVHYN